MTTSTTLASLRAASTTLFPLVFYFLLFAMPCVIVFKQLYTRHVANRTSWASELRARQKAYEEARPRPPKWLLDPTQSAPAVSLFSSPTASLRIGGHDSRANSPVVLTFDPSRQLASRLFALPAELRLLIYRQVLGDTRVHCIPLHKRVGYFTCCSTAGTPIACTCDGAIFPDEHGSGGNTHLHKRFHAWWNAKTLPTHLPTPDLGMLRACRQAYVEAGSLFYDSNAFAIHSIWTPLDMPSVIAPFRLQQLKRLTLGFSFGAHGLVPLMSPISRNEMHAPATDEMWLAMWKSLATHFTGVKELSIWLEMRSLDLFVQVELEQWATPLLRLSRARREDKNTGMDLESVQVRLSGWDRRLRTRAEEIPALEKRLERMLLGHEDELPEAVES